MRMLIRPRAEKNAYHCSGMNFPLQWNEFFPAVVRINIRIQRY